MRAHLGLQALAGCLNPHRSGSSSSAHLAARLAPMRPEWSQSPSFGVFVFGVSWRNGVCSTTRASLNPHRSGSSSSAGPQPLQCWLLLARSQSPSFGVFVFGRSRREGHRRPGRPVSIPIVRGLRLRPPPPPASTVPASWSQSPSFGVFVFGRTAWGSPGRARRSLNPHRSGSSSSARPGATAGRTQQCSLNPHRSGSSSSARRRRTVAHRRHGLNPHRSGSSPSASKAA